MMPWRALWLDSMPFDCDVAAARGEKPMLNVCIAHRVSFLGPCTADISRLVCPNAGALSALSTTRSA